jgi:hypothetical protein
MVDLWRDFWMRETGTGPQVAQLHDIWWWWWNLNVLYCKKKMRLSKFTPSRLMYTVVGNLSTGYCCCKCFCCNMIVHEVRRKRVKCHYTSNRQLHTVLLKLQRYYKTPTLTYFEPYYPITREHAAVIYNCVLPDDGIFFFLWRCGPTRAMASSFLRFLDHTRWRITVGRTPLDEWSARRRDLYLTT